MHQVAFALDVVLQTTRDCRLGVLRKISIKIPPLLRNLRLEKNLNYLKNEVKKRIPEAIAGEGPLSDEQQEKAKEKFKRAEEKLRKILDTKNC